VNRLSQDFRYGLRQLRQNPGFTLAAILTLSLSIGANTAIFSVINALLLKSLPYPNPERIGTIFTRITGPSSSDERHHIDGEQWELLRDDVPALTSAISGIRPAGINLEAGSTARYIHAGRISAHYLDVLGIHPVIGRNFTDAEDAPHGPNTAILSYDLWRSTFGSDRTIVGRSIRLKGESYTVLGVLPQGAITPINADVYTAIQASQQGEGGGTNFECITRLRRGATWQEADAQINRAWLSRSSRYELQDNPGAQVSYYSVPLQEGQSVTLGPQILGLMFASVFILLIACANLAGLTLVRVLRRTPEIATRCALGASHGRIQLQIWVENLLLAIIGGIAGVAVGFLALRALLALLPEYFLPVADVSLDPRVLVFAFALCVLTSLLFGMIPALAARTFDLRSIIAGRSGTTVSRIRLRQTLIAGEIALTVVLLAGSGLLIRTLVHLETLPPGFDGTGVMTARASLDNVRYYDAAAFRKLLSESTAAMLRIPGVQRAAVGLSLPYERALTAGNIEISDGKEAGQKVTSAEVYVTPDYFSALGISLVLGRAFTEGDGPDTKRVAVVNRSFVRKFFHGANPVGRHLMKDTLIVGVVGDVTMAPAIDGFAPLGDEQTMYVPATQMKSRQLSLLHIWFQPSWIVRTSHPVEGLTGQMQRALASVDPDLPFSGFYRMQDLLAKTLAAQRVEVALLSAMGGLALLLSAVGMFALVANLVAQRTKEIGIRIALGSTVRQAMGDIAIPGLRAAALGLVLGLLLCSAVLRVMRGLLYGIGVYDATTILSVIALLAFTTIAATTMPTLRIARIDPAETLREE
jgi:predicted permease